MSDIGQFEFLEHAIVTARIVSTIKKQKIMELEGTYAHVYGQCDELYALCCDLERELVEVVNKTGSLLKELGKIRGGKEEILKIVEKAKGKSWIK